MIKSELKTSILVLAVVVALTACSSATTNQTPPTSTAPQKSSIALRPCNLGDLPAQCGTLSVFEDRAARSGRKIDLRVAVIKARSAQPASDPVFYLVGGPGESATEWASYAMSILGSANEQRDVVFVDLRGTGGLT